MFLVACKHRSFQNAALGKRLSSRCARQTHVQSYRHLGPIISHTWNRFRSRHDESILSFKGGRSTIGNPLATLSRSLNHKLQTGKESFAVSPTTDALQGIAFQSSSYLLLNLISFERFPKKSSGRWGALGLCRLSFSLSGGAWGETGTVHFLHPSLHADSPIWLFLVLPLIESKCGVKREQAWAHKTVFPFMSTRLGIMNVHITQSKRFSLVKSSGAYICLLAPVHFNTPLRHSFKLYSKLISLEDE